MSGHDMGSMGGQGTSGQAGSEHKHGAQGQGQAASGGQMSGMSGASGMMAQMKRLENLSGAEFDREFAKDMIQHHQAQIRMSQRAVKEAKHDEVREFAQKTVADQKTLVRAARFGTRQRPPNRESG